MAGAAAAAAAAAATFLERGKRGIFLGILTLENDMLKIRKTCFSTCSNYGDLANILVFERISWLNDHNSIMVPTRIMTRWRGGYTSAPGEDSGQTDWWKILSG